MEIEIIDLVKSTTVHGPSFRDALRCLRRDFTVCRFYQGQLFSFLGRLITNVLPS